MRRLPVLLALAAATMPASPARADSFIITYEAPTIQNTTAGFSYKGVETFNERATGTGQTFTTTYGTSSNPTVITGTYTGVQVNAADQYGGAGGTGTYAVTFTNAGYSLAVSAASNYGAGPSAPINYFGFWLSALDAGNKLTFYNGSTQVFTFSPAQVQALLGSNPAYLGNPNAAFLGKNSGQPYVFLNFYDTSGSFTNVAFSENPAGGGYESDNQTVGSYTSISGTEVPMPEPAALAILGTGLAGLGLIRRVRSRRPLWSLAR